ncbi:MAG: cysteine desulfurase family protein [Cyanobacteria bacterium J06649_5]
MQIYLDYSATTPTRPEAIAAMHSAMEQHWGNASSLHQWGNRAATALERSRIKVAGLLNVADEVAAKAIVFTAGGSEANNLAILGTAQQYDQPQHLIISSVEHSAVAEPARQLAAKGWQVTQLPVNRDGTVHPDTLRSALQPNTALVSIIYGQSEVGTLQPIAELGAIARSQGVLFHTDAVQVAGRLPIDVQQLPVDLLSISSHKIYGPQGAGALYIRPNIRPNIRPERPSSAVLSPIIWGGGQEQGLRSGTQAVPAIVGFGVAAELAAKEMPTETLRLIHLRDRFFSLMAETLGIEPTGDPRNRLPHHVSFCLPHTQSTHEPVTGKALVRQMNLAGIGISAGSACHSGQLSPSPILKAMGYDDTCAKSGIRLTLGRHTTEADIDWSATVLKQLLARLRPRHSVLQAHSRSSAHHSIIS